jgi:hypothetical protein
MDPDAMTVNPTFPTKQDVVRVDVQPAPTALSIGKNTSPLKPAPAPSVRSRNRSPLTLALEAELARVRAKTKRSVPNFVVNTGNASRVGDQDDSAVQDFPAGERVS